MLKFRIKCQILEFSSFKISKIYIFLLYYPLITKMTICFTIRHYFFKKENRDITLNSIFIQRLILQSYNDFINYMIIEFNKLSVLIKICILDLGIYLSSFS